MATLACALPVGLEDRVADQCARYGHTVVARCGSADELQVVLADRRVQAALVAATPHFLTATAAGRGRRGGCPPDRGRRVRGRPPPRVHPRAVRTRRARRAGRPRRRWRSRLGTGRAGPDWAGVDRQPVLGPPGGRGGHGDRGLGAGRRPGANQHRDLDRRRDRRRWVFRGARRRRHLQRHDCAGTRLARRVAGFRSGVPSRRRRRAHRRRAGADRAALSVTPAAASACSPGSAGQTAGPSCRHPASPASCRPCASGSTSWSSTPDSASSTTKRCPATCSPPAATPRP